MNARDKEQAKIETCMKIVAGNLIIPETSEDANVIHVAAMLSRAKHKTEASRLLLAATHYFHLHPETLLSTKEVVQRGWVSSLPRFRSMLDKRMNNP